MTTKQINQNVKHSNKKLISKPIDLKTTSNIQSNALLLQKEMS